VEGASDEIFSLVDQVAARLLAGLEGGPAARVDRIAAVTTSSLPALKAYLEGQVALRAGDFSTAVDAFQYAVDQDTLFALGYYRLSIAAEWLLRSELSHDSAQRAFQYADRLSLRDRRLLEAFSTFRRGEVERAEGLYRALVATYPDEVEAWLYLGELLFHMNPLRARSQAEAREPFLKLLELEPGNTATLVHLARIEAMEGRDQEVDRYVTRFVELASDADRLWPMQALRAFSRQDRAEQDRLLNEVERAPGATLTLIIWDVAISSRDIPGAERVARIMTAPWRPVEERALGHVHLAHFLLAQGRWNAAQQELEAAAALDPATALEHRALLSSMSFVPSSPEALAEIRDDLRAFDAGTVPDAQNPETFFASHNGLHPLLREYLLGLVSARLGDAPTADAQARRTAGTSAPPIVGSLPADLALGIRAQALIEQDRDADALAALEQLRFAINYNPMIASPFVSLSYERFTRAELLRTAGRDEEALAWYRYMFGCTAFEVVYLALSHLRQGEIYDRRGERDLAVRHYSMFLDLWRDADPEFQPLVEDAERQLAQLQRG
jgi:tetratricopeptide (TPR) repeat protein